MRVKLSDVAKHPSIDAYIQQADANLGPWALLSTDGATLVWFLPLLNVLERLGYDERLAELAAIAGYLHDLGNCVGRVNHGAAAALEWSLSCGARHAAS